MRNKRAASEGDGALFYYFEAWFDESEDRISDAGKFIGEPRENRYSSKRNDSNVEFGAEFICLSVGDSAEDRVAMHLREHQDHAATQNRKQAREDPVDELPRLERIRVPGHDRQNEGKRDEHHQVAQIHEDSANQRQIANGEKLFSDANVFGFIDARVRTWLLGFPFYEFARFRFPVRDQDSLEQHFAETGVGSFERIHKNQANISTNQGNVFTIEEIFACYAENAR